MIFKRPEYAVALLLGALMAHIAGGQPQALEDPERMATSLPDEETVNELEAFVVTGTALPMPATESPADLAVLAGREKLRRQSGSLGESLAEIPSVSNIQTGSGVGVPVIRGLSGNRIRVLQDGIGVNYQQFGNRHPANLDPFLTERIEVIRGVASLFYGSDAFGGAVNAISPSIVYDAVEGATAHGRAIYRYESVNDLHTGELQFSFTEDNWGLVAGIVGRDAGNLRVPEVEVWAGPPPTGQPSDIPRFAGDLDFTDFDQLNGFVKIGTRFGGIEATLRYERWDHENNYLLPTGGGIGVDLANNLVQTEWTGGIAHDWNWNVNYTWNQNLRRANPGGTPLPVENADVDLERTSHTLRAEFFRGRLEERLSGRIGFEGLYEDQESKGPTGLTPGGQVENLALFGVGRLSSDPWILEAGLRFDHRSQAADSAQTADSGLLTDRRDPVTQQPVAVNLDNRYHVVSASLGALYRVNDNLVLAANANRGFRAPDLFELYADGEHGGVAAFQFGDPNLDEETTLGGDIQARWRSAPLDWTATAYVTSFSDYIFLADTGSVVGVSGLPIFKVDQADATLYGGDVSVVHRATPWLRLEGIYEWVRGEFDDGGDVPLLPADQLQGTVIFWRESLGILEEVEFRVGIRHARSKDAAGLLEPFAQFDRNPNFGTASTGAYTLLDLGFKAAYKSLLLGIRARNVTDEDYRDFLDTYKGYALSPGRNIVFELGTTF